MRVIWQIFLSKNQLSPAINASEAPRNMVTVSIMSPGATEFLGWVGINPPTTEELLLFRVHSSAFAGTYIFNYDQQWEIILKFFFFSFHLNMAHICLYIMVNVYESWVFVASAIC